MGIKELFMRKDPYVPSSEKRYAVSNDEYSRKRIAALRDIHHELEKENDRSLSLAMHGSLTKGKVLTPEIASRADIDMHLYFDAEGMEPGERIIIAGALREQMLKKLHARRSELGVIDKRFTVIPLDEHSIPHAVNKASKKSLLPNTEYQIRLANFFTLSIGPLIRTYRNQFLLELADKPDGEDQWKKIEGVIEKIERRGTIPDTLKKYYPKTLHQALVSYGVTSNMRTDRQEYGALQRHIDAELAKPLSQERMTELDREISQAAEFLQNSGIDFYVAGGSGLDLLDGTWDRDHQDLDVQIFSHDRDRLFDTATAAGFIITDSSRRKLQKNEVGDTGRENVFLFRSDSKGIQRFEVLFLPSSDQKIFLRGAVPVPENLFKKAPRAHIGGYDILLQPPEVILFYKVCDGRRKDFKDIQHTWANLTDEQRATIERFIQQAGTVFHIADSLISSIADLIEHTENINSEKEKKYFSGQLPRIKSTVAAELMKTANDIYEIRGQAGDKINFIRTLGEKYQGFMPERRTVIEQVADRLFSKPQLDLDGFSQWFSRLLQRDMNQRVVQRALHEYTNERLWEVMQRSDNV